MILGRGANFIRALTLSFCTAWLDEYRRVVEGEGYEGSGKKNSNGANGYKDAISVVWSIAITSVPRSSGEA